MAQTQKHVVRVEDVALEAIKAVIMDNALRYYNFGSFTKTINWRRLRKVASKLGERYGINPSAILACCGRILKAYSEPSRKGRPHNYTVNMLLLHKLFGLKWEDLRDKPIDRLTPLELYYTMLFLDGESYGENEDTE